MTTTSLGTRRVRRALLALALPGLLVPITTTVLGGPAEAAAPDVPRVIRYHGENGEVYVQRPAQVGQLVGAPRDFKRFVRGLVRGLDHGGCDAAAVGIGVRALRTDGFAVGGVSECGGYAALWARVDGTWKEVDGTQDTWDCSTLATYRVPSSIAGTHCYDYAGHQAHRYHQR